MNKFRADLHCHTTCSDGSLSPEELVRLASSLGLEGLSITDHDTIDAYPSAIPALQETGIKWISGVEFSSVYKGASIHMLAYSFRVDHPDILSFCQKHTERRRTRNRLILENLAANGMPISEEEFLATAPSLPGNVRGSMTRPHIALAMVKKGYVASVQEAFNKYLREGGLCYAPSNAFSVEETLEIIHKAKGLAFIAHPHLIQNYQIVQKLLEMDFDGLECYYGKFSPDEHAYWLKIAQKKNILISGGSDFHGAIKPNIQLGCSWVNEQLFRPLHDHFIHNS